MLAGIKTSLLFFILLCTCTLASAQLAPDFTVTDSDGNVHHLYADYLNQGKTVMIEIFFTTCPPCNAIAPLIEPLYQDWGGGDYDVEFFDLSNKNFDTDALVNGYKANYGHTYPAAGVQGGSLAAVAPYEAGMFGPFYGTPTFIVIAPDGTVQYDVHGSNNTGTIAAIDAAITATGAVKPTCLNTYALNGSFCAGDSVQVHGVWYNVPGTYTDTAAAGSGCDSLFWITITEQPIITVIIDSTICVGETITINGITYSNPGSYLDTIQAQFVGCDTVVMITITVEPYNTKTINASVCPEEPILIYDKLYTGPGTYTDTIPALIIGCDTIVSIIITEVPLIPSTINASFHEGDSVLVYGIWYSVPGTFMDTIAAATGCDTVVTINVSEIPDVPIDISAEGFVKTFNGTPIANAYLVVKDTNGLIVGRDTTDGLGQFVFTFDSTYFFTHMLTVEVIKTINPLNGVSVLDLVALQKHLLGLALLKNTEQLFAADVNRSGMLSVLDILYMRRLLLGFETGFSTPETWVFFHESVDLGPPGPQPPILEVMDPVSLQAIYAGTMSPIFRGIKLGDLNNSANPLN